jgi:hypothetical protein
VIHEFDFFSTLKVLKFPTRIMKPPTQTPSRPARAGQRVEPGGTLLHSFPAQVEDHPYFPRGLLGAGGLYLAKPPMYQSQAKILIRFILESKNTVAADDDARVKSPDSRGDNIINSEIEILTSFDLAGLVADVVGPEKVLAQVGGGTDRTQAAAVIRRGVQVDVPRRSNVLLITFRHPTQAWCSPSSTPDRNLPETTRRNSPSVGVLDDFFLRQADQLRARLSETEGQLKKLRADAQIISLEESKAPISNKLPGSAMNCAPPRPNWPSAAPRWPNWPKPFPPGGGNLYGAGARSGGDRGISAALQRTGRVAPDLGRVAGPLYR